MRDDGGRVPGELRPLRFWAVADAVYASLLAALVMFVIPAKAPGVKLALLLFAAAVGGPAPWLWRRRRWAWRAGVLTSLLGLAAAALLAAALVASWAYLRAIYGGFGRGASLASLLIAGMVIEVLGLYPALRLRALLRRELRVAMAAASGRAPVVAAIALALLPVPVAMAIDLRFGLRPLAPLPATAATQALALLRAHAEGRALPPAPALAGVAVGTGPLHVTLWEQGAPVVRVSGAGADLQEAVADAGRALARAVGRGAAPPSGRLKLDRVVARGPVLVEPEGVFALSFDPGLDGLVDGDGRLAFLPDDVLRARVAGAAAPLPDLDELRLGIDPHWMRDRLSAAGGGTPARRPPARIRVESWLEDADHAGVRPVHRGNTPAAGARPGEPLPLAQAALDAGDFILRQAETDGRFAYVYDPIDDAPSAGGAYSLPRHAGTAYGLTLLFAHTGQDRFREAAMTALGWLARQIPPRCGPDPSRSDWACMVEHGEAPLGMSALAAIAMLEYERRTSDTRYARLAAGLLAFLRGMQLPGGNFHQVYGADAGAVLPSPPRMFASEQAALALVLGHRLRGDPALREAAGRALDHLTGAKYDYFLGRFMYGADHWTCIAAEEAWPALPHRRYLDFCTGYAAFMARLQYQPAGAGAAAASAGDFAGHYGFGQLMVPQAPATAGFAEALLSTLALARHHGAPSEGLYRQARLALGALARDQLRADNSYLAKSPARAAGGIRRSLVEPEIRIDFVQHAASALVRGQALGIK